MVTQPARKPRRKTRATLVPPNPEAAALIDAVTEHFQDVHTFAHEDDAFLLAVWVIQCWLIDAYDHTVYIAILSHEPDCGKTELIRAICRLCPQPARSVYPTLAGITRYYVSGNRVLIIDQIHSLTKSRKFDMHDFVAAIANGHTRDAGDTALAGADNESIEYRSTFGPKLFAGLTSVKFDEEIDSRLLRILARPGSDTDARERERRKKLRPVRNVSAALAAGLERFASPELIARVRAATETRETIPLNAPGTELYNRDCDNWLALISITDMAGDEYGKRMRDIAARRTDGRQIVKQHSSEADHIDRQIMTAIRSGKLPVDSFAMPGQPPVAFIKERAMLLVTDADFGWQPGNRRKSNNDALATATLYVKSEERRAELRLRPDTMRGLCEHIGMSYRTARKAYKDAGRLVTKTNGDDMCLALYSEQTQRTMTAIDFSSVVFNQPGASRQEE